MERLHETVTLTEPRSRYMLLAARKASLPAQIAETMWVLSGRDDVDWLSTYLPALLSSATTVRSGAGPTVLACGRSAVRPAPPTREWTSSPTWSLCSRRTRSPAEP